MKERHREGLASLDMLLFWLALALWFAVFLVGTLVGSAPYRSRFAAFEGGVVGTIENGLLVVFIYTLTNVAILSILAGVLGALGAKAVLGSDAQRGRDLHRDTTSPKSSAVLRGFLVYLTLIAGVLALADHPTEPTQIQYVRLAGLVSLVGFFVNYRPTIFGRLLERVGRLIAYSDIRPKTGVETGAKPITPDSHSELETSLADEIAKLVELHKSGVFSSEEFQRAKERLLQG